MKAKLLSAAKKLAAIATSAMFLGVTVGAASAYSMSSLPSPFVQNGHVNATFVVGTNAAPVDIIGAIAIATGLTAAAGSSHSGSGSFATIGKLVTTSKSATYETLYTTPGEASTFNISFSKPSLTVNAQNFTISSTHYAAIENLSLFSTANVNAPYINSNLGVTFPSGSVELVSYVAAGNTTAVGATQKFTKGLQYLIGKTMYTFISNATKGSDLANVSLGAMQTFNNVKIPSTLTVGTNTIDVQSVGSLVFPSHTYNTIDVSINGGSTQVLNLSQTYTNVNGTGVTITVGPSYSTIGGVTTLDYLEASSVGITQNVTANTKGDANLFGLGSNYNVSYVPINSTYKATGTELTFFNTNNITLPYSFSASNSFELPVNLTSMSLEKLAPTWGNSKNVTVTTGQKATDTFTAVVEKNTTASPVAPLAFTHGLPDVAYGVSFRGNNISTTTGLFTVPNLLLYHYQKIYTGESPYQFLVGESEYIYPVPTNPAFAVTTAPSGLSSANSSAFFFNTTSGPYANVSTNLQPSKVVYELPNGNMFAVRFSPVYDTNNTYYNFTSGVDLFRPTIQNLTNNTLGILSSPVPLSSNVVDNASFKVSATLPTLGWNSSKVNSTITGIKHTIPTSNFFLNGTSKTLYLNLSNGTKFLKITLSPVFDSNISYYNSSHANMTFKYLNDSWEERVWNVTGVTNLFSSNPVTNNSKVAGYTVDLYNYNVILSNKAVNRTAPTTDFGFANELKMIRNLTVSGPIVFTVGGSGSTVGATLKDTEKVWNSSTLLNYTASTASSPTVNAIVLNKNYTFGGYNVSFSALPFSLGNKAEAPSNTPYYGHSHYYGYSNQSVYGMEMKLVGPSVTMNINSKEFGVTPGVSGLYYTTNGTEFSSFNNGVLGSVAFNGNAVAFLTVGKYVAKLVVFSFIGIDIAVPVGSVNTTSLPLNATDPNTPFVAELRVVPLLA